MVLYFIFELMFLWKVHRVRKIQLLPSQSTNCNGERTTYIEALCNYFVEMTTLIALPERSCIRLLFFLIFIFARTRT